MTPRRPLRYLPALSVAIVLAAILLLTLDRFEMPPPGVQLWEWCFLCGEQWGIDILRNVALFVPLGLTIRLAGGRPGPALLGIAATSFVIEILQLFITGRITSIDDLIANTLGGILGFVAGGHLGAIVLPRARQAVRAVVVAGAVVLVVFPATLWLFGPDPTAPPYTAQFSPELVEFGRLRGTVLEAGLGDRSLVAGPVTDPRSVGEHLRGDSVIAYAVVRGGRATQRLAPVFRLVDGERDELLLLGRRDGRSLTVRFRGRARRLGLHRPSVTVADAFPDSSGNGTGPAVHIAGTIRGYSISAASSYTVPGSMPVHVRRTIAFRPTYGWAYLMSFEPLLSPRAGSLTTVWLVMLFAPVGYLGAIAAMRMRAALRRLAIVLWVTAVAALALVATPLAMGLSAATAGEWLGGVLGLSAGALAGVAAMVVVRRRRPQPVRHTSRASGRGR